MIPGGSKGGRLVYGIHAVAALLDRPQRLRELWVADSAGLEVLALARRAQSMGVAAVYSVDRRDLDAASEGGVHQGVLAWADFPEFVAPDEFFASLLKTNGLALAFDGVTDPHNMGACLRSLEAFGGMGALYAERRQSDITAVVSKAAAGAVEYLRLCRVVNLARALNDARETGVRVLGLAGEGTANLGDVPPGEPTLIVIGAEGDGLRRLTRERCDTLVKIPLTGRTSSLNAAVACGIALAHLSGAMSQMGKPPGTSR